MILEYKYRSDTYPNLDLTFNKLYKVLSPNWVNIEQDLVYIKNDKGISKNYSIDFFNILTEIEEQKYYREDKLKRILK